MSIRGTIRLAFALSGLAATVVVASPAAGHALLQSSQPAAGDTLSTSPSQVTITFGEQPDPDLSSIKVLDTSGATVAAGPVQVVAADPRQLQVALPSLPAGVYTVAWRTVSAVDGHLATGSYAFGVGVAPPPPAGPASGQGGASGSSTLSPVGILGRWLLYVGLIVLLGAAGVALAVHPVPPAATGLVMAAAWLAAVAGTLVVLGDQVATVGVDLGRLLGTSFGPAIGARGAPLVLAAVPLAVTVRRRPAPRWSLVALAVASAAAMLADVWLSHAAAGPDPLVNGTVQWLHVLAVGAWLGGLVCLLITLRGSPGPATGAAARRFARIATLGIATVAVTGIIRAVVEIGTLDALFGSDFGRLVLVKSALFLILAGLGAVNHFRNVPAAHRVLRGLRRVGSTELLMGATALLVAAALVNVAPPSESAAASAAAPTSITVSGADFGTSVRLTLTAAPGTAGFDSFRAVVTDYDSGAPLDGATVSLRFAIPARPDVGGSRLDLARAGSGTYEASGGNLSLDGTWRITAVVTHGTTSVEVPLEVTTRQVAQQVDVNRQPGLPTVYIVHLAAAQTVQIYLDPGTAGANEIHATFFDAAGNELPVPSARMAIGPTGQTPSPVTPRELEPGHFVGDQTLAAGTYRLTVTGTAPAGGGALTAGLDVEVTP